MSVLTSKDLTGDVCRHVSVKEAAKIPFALVGLNFGRSIVRYLTEGEAASFFKLTAVCDLDPAKVEHFSRLTGARPVHTLEKLLEDDEIRVIGLFTPPFGRAELIRQVIRAGKDVVTTKPFETDVVAAREVLEEAARLGRAVHLNSPSPELSPDLALIEQWRKDFRLGRAVACRAEMWCSYREASDGSWYDDPMVCPAAPVFRLGIYLINDMVRLFGKAKQVSVLQSRLFTGRPTPDNAQLGILFENGSIANIFASFCIEDGDHYRSSMVLNYENGTIYRNAGPERKSLVQDFCELFLVTLREGKRSVVKCETVDSSSGSYQWEAFARTIRAGEGPSLSTVDQVVAGLQILEAMRQSVKSGGPVDIA